MKNVIAGVAGVLLLSALAFAAGGEKKSTAVLTPTPQLSWVDVPGAPGVQTSVVEGDATKGPHHFYLKFPAGFSVGAHYHSADHFGTLLTGTLVLTVDGQDHVLPAGSYVGFTKKTKHATKCQEGADCIMFIDAKAKWDAVFDDAKASAKKG